MKYNTIYAFGENNESGFRSRQVPVLRGLISIVLSVINSGPNIYYGIDRIPICTGSGMYRLHCIDITCDTCTFKFMEQSLMPYSQKPLKYRQKQYRIFSFSQELEIKYGIYWQVVLQ